MDSLYKTNLLFFFAAFIFTIFFVYLTTPQPDVIYKYPTPETAGELVYQQKDGNCYKYNSKVVPCPSNPRVI